METLTLINGNNQPMTKYLPLLVIFAKEINDAALAHIRENTGLDFVLDRVAYVVQPTESKQIAALFLTCNFKTRYYDNANFKNQIHLKFDHHIGFDVDSICFDCVKRNHLHTGGLEPGDYLAC